MIRVAGLEGCGGLGVRVFAPICALLVHSGHFWSSALQEDSNIRISKTGCAWQVLDYQEIVLAQRRTARESGAKSRKKRSMPTGWTTCDLLVPKLRPAKPLLKWGPKNKQ